MCARTAPLSDSFCHKSCNTWEEICSPEVPHEVPLHSSLASQPLIGPAWPNSAQGTARWRQRESQLQQQKWCKRLPLPAHTHFPLHELSHLARPEIFMESLWYTGPHLSIGFQQICPPSIVCFCLLCILKCLLSTWIICIHAYLYQLVIMATVGANWAVCIHICIS